MGRRCCAGPAGSGPGSVDTINPVTAPSYDADLIVVGAGPSGSATAYHAAQAGLDVLLLEKTSFPREKVCGDGLTPRGVKGVQRMGIDVSPEHGWIRNVGLRIYGGGHRLELPWQLVQRAQKAGARLREETSVTGPVLDERTGRVLGVTARSGGREGDDLTYRAPLVVAADGTSARLPIAVGRKRREDRPLGVAYRAYFRSAARTHDDHLESWLELWGTDPATGQRVLLPGYGWVFGMGDGTSNIGLGLLNTTKAFQNTDYRALLRSWLAQTPAEWGFTPENQVGAIRGAALPMGFNRAPLYANGMLLVGDAGGAVNPFNGEGIAYALETGETAAEVIAQALREPEGASREKALSAYSLALKARYGGYFTLGRVFVKLIGNPRVMQLATERGLPHPLLMKLTMKLLANLTDPHGGDALDRIVNGLSKVAPAA